MPYGLKRYQESRQSHFVTFSCYRRQPHLCDPSICRIFLDSLERTRCMYRFRVYGYVLMPEYVHLLVSEPEAEQLATAIQALKISVARRAPRDETRRGGPFWQRRYYDHNVRTAESFVEKLRYIHRNPVKRGLVENPEDWHWSSFCHYATAEISSVEIESQWTADRRSGRKVKLMQLREN